MNSDYVTYVGCDFNITFENHATAEKFLVLDRRWQDVDESGISYYNDTPVQIEKFSDGREAVITMAYLLDLDRTIRMQEDQSVDAVHDTWVKGIIPYLL